MSATRARILRARGIAIALATGVLGLGLPGAARGATLEPLRLDGRHFVNSAGARVVLRGCNLGNWLLIEPWMLGIHDDQVRDQHDFVTALESRFGAGKTAALLDLYRTNWITGRELALARTFGFNVVRLPFDYALLMDDERPLVLRDDAFRWLDRGVDLAEQAGLYVILDLHGAPGGQSVDAPTGWRDRNELWRSAARQEQTAWLWQRIAERYRDRAAVVAYDLLNEPWSDFKADVRADLLPVVGRLYDAIRAVDSEKLIYAPGALQGITFYGDPQERGWKNVGLTEHFYPGLFGQGSASLETHARFLGLTVPAKRAYIEQVKAPYLVGEFNVVFDRVAKPELSRAYYDAFTAGGWAATLWSLRLVHPEGGIGPDGWYLVTNARPFILPDLRTGSYDEFAAAFRTLGTQELVAHEPVRTALSAPQAPALPLATYPHLVAAAPTRDALPGWTMTDVAATPAGGLCRAPGCELPLYGPHPMFVLYGGGADVWGQRDEFCYHHRAVTGDFAVETWLVDFAAPHAFGKAGWMARASLEPNAAHVFVHAFQDGCVMLAWRSTTDGATHERCLGISGLPVGLGLRRTDEQLTVRYTTCDGSWHEAPVPTEARLPASAIVGLAVNAHDPHVLAAATFMDPDRAGPPALDDAQNLLRNASFEDALGDTATDQAAHWGRWGAWINRETGWTPRRDGACILAYHHFRIEDDRNSGVYQDVPNLGRGSRCTFSVYVSRDVPAAGRHGPAEVELRIESPFAGQLVTVASRTYNAADIASDGEWSRLKVSGTLPADAARVLIVVNPSRAAPRDAALKFDAATLSKQSPTETTQAATAQSTSHLEVKP